MAGPNYYDIFVNEFQARAPKITDKSEGSILDVMGGSIQTSLQESDVITAQRFARTLLGTAHGPEVTGGEDDLENLAVDHFGEEFRRPKGSYSTGLVKFSRPNADKGDVSVPAGTVVLSRKNIDGKAFRFKTKTAAIMVGIDLTVEVESTEVGSTSNIAAGQIQGLEGALSDSSITVTNLAGFGGGTFPLNDADYRELCYSLLASKQGSTTRAVKARAKSVAGVFFAEPVERILTVKEWDIPTETATGEYFKIFKVDLYVSDASGTASPSLVNAVRTAVGDVRALGVLVNIVAATAIILNWKAQIALNPEGPNYEALFNDSSLITDAMAAYLNSLTIGQTFNKNDARAHIMAIFGPAGSNDLTDFFTLLPAASVATGSNQKIIPGTCEVV